jgi:hypothetical protein
LGPGPRELEDGEVADLDEFDVEDGVTLET